MARYITRAGSCSPSSRSWLLVTIVFVISNVLPRDVGRTILGPFAPQEIVDALNERLGHEPAAAGPLRRLSRGIVTLDFGNSFVSGQAVLPQILAAAGRSAKLAGLALVITIPTASQPGCMPRDDGIGRRTGRSSCSA